MFLDGSGAMTDCPIDLNSFGFANSADTTEGVDATVDGLESTDTATISQVMLTGGSNIMTNDPIDLSSFGIVDFVNGAEITDAAVGGQEVCLDESESTDAASQEVCLDESESTDAASREVWSDEFENTDSIDCGQEARLDSLADGLMNLDGFGISCLTEGTDAVFKPIEDGDSQTLGLEGDTHAAVPDITDSDAGRH